MEDYVADALQLEMNAKIEEEAILKRSTINKCPEQRH